MCGIVGYVGERVAKTLVLAGLERLEYRGYDSAGISVVCDGRLEAVRAVGNLSRLRAAVEAAAPAEDEGGGVAVAAPPATTGIGHTRWATHGRVTEENAHPHYDTEDRVHVVVNGIVENYLELKQALIAAGAVFTSETDAEVIAHLISRELSAGHDLVEAVRAAYLQLRGHYAFVAVAADDQALLVAARRECPRETLLVPRTFHVFGDDVVIDAAELFQLRVEHHARLQRRHRIDIFVDVCITVAQRGALAVSQQRKGRDGWLRRCFLRREQSDEDVVFVFADFRF